MRTKLEDRDLTPDKQARQKIRDKRSPAVPTTKATKPAIDNGGTVASIVRPGILTFDVVGISSLLQNNPAAFIGKSDSQDLTAKIVYNDTEEARLRVYVHESSELYYHPTQAFINAMIRAVSGMKFGKVFATSAIRGSVFAADAHTYILNERGEHARDYKIDRQPVVIGKSRILRCRPIWNAWRVKLSLDVDTGLVGEKQVRAALELAGRRVGIGDYRPEKGGGFGRFRVE